MRTCGGRGAVELERKTEAVEEIEEEEARLAGACLGNDI